MNVRVMLPCSHNGVMGAQDCDASRGPKKIGQIWPNTHGKTSTPCAP